MIYLSESIASNWYYLLVMSALIVQAVFNE
jgi:hypothetical protein